MSDYEMPSLLGEEDYRSRMEGEVAQWAVAHLHEGVYQSFDNVKLQYYYALTPKGKGCVVVLHGFCEFVGKYREMLYTFWQAGYHVFFHEQRGHGRSGGKVPGDYIYVKDFSDYERDLKGLLDEVYRPLAHQQGGNASWLLFAHSMGGAVGTLFLEDLPGYFDAAVLSAPMHRMKMGGLKNWQVQAVIAYAKVFHRQLKPLFGQGPFNPEESFEESCALSRARFDYVLQERIAHREYQTGGATFGWSAAAVAASKRVASNAAAVQIPVLLMQAGEDTLVEADAQNAFASRSGHTVISVFKTARHEIMNADDENRRRFYREILAFFAARAAGEEA